MFFTKNVQPPVSQNKNIAVIGTSPLAFFLADTLQNNGCQTTIIVSPAKLDGYKPLNPFTVKPARFQSRHTNFHFASSVDFKPDFCFLASAPTEASSDLLFLSAEPVKLAPLINCSSFYNHRLLPKISPTKEISGYFSGGLNLNKNTLIHLKSLPKLQLCSTSDTAVQIKRLFDDSQISITLSHHNKTFFWEHLSVFFLSNLLLISEPASLVTRLTDPDTRNQAELAAAELVKLAKKHKISLDSSEILAGLYDIEDGSHSEFTTPAALNVLLNILPEINRFDTPSLFRLSANAVNKMLA